MKQVHKQQYRKNKKCAVMVIKISLLCYVLMGFSVCGHRLLADDVQGFPADALKATSGPLKTINDLVTPVEDYRSFLVDEKLLQNRVARSVCVIDSTNKFHGRIQEASVTSGTSLEAVLEASGVHNWRGQGTIFLFQKNGIVRSPSQLPKADKDRFLQTPIYPGDMIYFGFVF